MIFGLTGRKRSGKDTAGEVFEAMGFTRLSFAAPIKIMIGALLTYQGVDDETVYEMLEGSLKETPTEYLGGRSPRHAMQTLGTEWGRNMITDTLWIDALLNAAQQHELVVVTDVRFPNEVEVCDQVWRISRPGNTAVDAHPSEAQIDDLDVEADLVNDAPSAEVFQDRVATMLTARPLSKKRH